MKRNKFYICAVFLGLFFSSCESMVEIEPRNELSPQVVTGSLSGLQSVLNSAYVRLLDFGYYGRDMVLMGDALSDNIYTVADFAGGRYVNVNQNLRGSHFNIWSNSYGGINELNTVIAYVDALSVAPSDEAARISLKAEALALRALYYFDLARIYGYEPTSVSATGFDRSVVIRLTPTEDPSDAAMINRSSISEVYAAIESDLDEAIGVFASGAASNTRHRMTIGAAYALRGKVKLYAGRWADAVSDFDLAFSNSSAQLGTSYISDFAQALNPESFFQISFTASTQMSGVTGGNNSLYSYTHPDGYNGFTTFGGQTVPAGLLSLFEEDDDRLEMFFEFRGNTGLPESAPLFTWNNKYSGATAAYTDNPIILRYADVLLMEAEAQARLGEYAAARALLVTLREARSASTASIPSGESLIEYIKDERRRELFFEGHRWFDLKRWATGVTKATETNVATIPADDYRLLAPIPNDQVVLNPQLPQNPNY